MNMELRLTIRTDNAAFEESDELQRLLNKVAARVGAGNEVLHAQSIMDSNGNRVGQWKIVDDDE